MTSLKFIDYLSSFYLLSYINVHRYIITNYYQQVTVYVIFNFSLTSVINNQHRGKAKCVMTGVLGRDREEDIFGK